MWNGAAADDTYLLHFSSDYLDLSWVTKATEPGPTARLTVPAAIWNKLTDIGNKGIDLNVKLARLSGSSATMVSNHTWKIAGARLEGVMYYWANGDGRIHKLNPNTGISEPILPTPDGSVPGCTACHVVSASGNRIAATSYDAGATPGSNGVNRGPLLYDFTSATPVVFNQPRTTPDTALSEQYSNAAMTSKGEYLVKWNPTTLDPITSAPIIFKVVDPATNLPIADTGLDGISTAFPFFSADDKLLAYSTDQTSIWAADWTMQGPKASNFRKLVAPPPGMYTSYLSASPDHRWIVYQGGDSTGSLLSIAADAAIPREADTQKGTSDLYLATTEQASDGAALLNLNGPPGSLPARDFHRNYEPAFAPIASGGYLWVVFTSRRSYGNRYVSSERDSVVGEANVFKLLWVAAIDLNAEPGKDASHPAFFLSGQAGRSVETPQQPGLNLKAFWSLDQCRAQGKECKSGAQCCSGTCEPVGENSAYVCSTASGCSETGNRCEKKEDCCNSSDSCIGGFCEAFNPR